MQSFLSPQMCTGCAACAASCPNQCIKMVADDDGFLYPQIQVDRCTDCHFCASVCPVLHPKSLTHTPDAYAVMNKNEDIRERSSSGGVFFLLAEYIIEQGGVVFGAKFDESFKVVHGYAETLEGVQAFMGSKYTQSEIGQTYSQAKEFLETGRLVLFTGTPCQIGGLKAYLRREYTNLLCQDVICHGVPSPAVWKKYIEYREAEAASTTRRTFFRHKKYGWKMFSVQFDFTNCTEYIQVHSVDLYMRSFLRDLDLRSSCYNCSFKGAAIEADITLADFWGIEKVAPEMDDNHGTSLVIVHTEKGCKLFEAIRGNTKWQQVDFEQAIMGNPSMVRSVPKNPNRDRFMLDIQTKPFEKVVKKYCSDKLIVKIKRKLKSIYRKIKPRKG